MLLLALSALHQRHQKPNIYGPRRRFLINYPHGAAFFDFLRGHRPAESVESGPPLSPKSPQPANYQARPAAPVFQSLIRPAGDATIFSLCLFRPLTFQVRYRADRLTVFHAGWSTPRIGTSSAYDRPADVLMRPRMRPSRHQDMHHASNIRLESLENHLVSSLRRNTLAATAACCQPCRPCAVQRADARLDLHPTTALRGVGRTIIRTATRHCGPGTFLRHQVTLNPDFHIP